MPDPLTEQKMQTCKPNGENTQCLCITIHWDFESPIIDATNEKESWLEAWTAHIETLQTQACYWTHAIGHIGETTLRWQRAKVTLGPD